ncbi:ceramidase domain-containing protein [Pseudooceanicola sp. C21-150M6]|uniref:ceramidase domain-containing protein n=1 Tax=Pseudooceanicola sp. C21-150M6 TaxID=3434355 RepID=UPI003D7F7953
MDWTASVDGYCERLGPEVWAEPLNAVTNLAFVIAGLWVWRRGTPGPVRVLAALLIAIGVGSGLFHTLAVRWAGVADVLPILFYVLAYIFFANRYYWRLRPVWAGAVTLGFFPYAAATVPLFGLVPGLGSSAGYAPIPLLIFGYALALWRRLPEVARGLAIGAAILCLSILFRALDMPLCSGWPRGTHFLWHLLNAVMLAWMAEVLRRHLAGAGGGR